MTAIAKTIAAGVIARPMSEKREPHAISRKIVPIQDMSEKFCLTRTTTSKSSRLRSCRNARLSSLRRSVRNGCRRICMRKVLARACIVVAASS
eukprot:scaffold219175_cov35-Tisochrysis_lutea.AAC.1